MAGIFKACFFQSLIIFNLMFFFIKCFSIVINSPSCNSSILQNEAVCSTAYDKIKCQQVL